MVKFVKKTLYIFTVFSFLSLIFFINNQDYTLAKLAYPHTVFLIGLLFFNTTHIFITALSLYFLPEFRSLSFLKSTEFITRCVFVFLGGILASVCFTTMTVGPHASTYFRIFIYSSTIHHTIMQIFGLSALSSPHHELNKFEKQFALFLFFSSAVFYTLVQFEIFEANFYFILSIMSLWVVFTVYSFFKVEMHIFRIKFDFLMRYLSVALCFIHPLLTLLTMTFHGLEYLQIFFESRKNSTLNDQKFFYSTVLLFTLIPAASLLLHARYVLNFFSISLDGHSNIAVMSIESLVVGLNVLHFYVDARIYQFKKLEVHQKIFPLFYKVHSGKSG